MDLDKMTRQEIEVLLKLLAESERGDPLVCLGIEQWVASAMAFFPAAFDLAQCIDQGSGVNSAKSDRPIPAGEVRVDERKLLSVAGCRPLSTLEAYAYE